MNTRKREWLAGWLVLAFLLVLVLVRAVRPEVCQTGQCPVCPAAAPAAPAAPAGPAAPCFGVDQLRIRSGRTTINGREVTEAEGRAAVGATLPSDGSSPFITVIGPAMLRQRVLADLKGHPVLSRLRSRWRVQEYGPEEWPVATGGFYLSGAPTIYLQSAAGAVLHRQDSYSGPEALAVALRKADPSYDPKADPDLSAPAPLSGLPTALKAIPSWGYVSAIGAVLVLVLAKKRG